MNIEIQLVLTMSKINEQKSENGISTIQQRLENAMKGANLAWWEMDLPSGTIRYDENKIKMMGYSKGDFIATHYSDFTKEIHPEDLPRTMKAMRDHLEGKKDKYEVDYRIKTKKGNYIWFHDKGEIALRDEENRPKKVIGIVIDISDRLETQFKLEQSEAMYKEAYNQINFYKDLISHDVNNMLQSILFYTDLILNDSEIKLSNKNREYLKNIERSVVRGSELIYHVSNLSNKLLIEKNRIHSNLNEILLEAIKNIKNYYSSLNIQINYTTRIHETIISGGGLILEAIENILRNSILHNENETKEIDIITSQIDNESKVKIEIIDNGNGIPDENKLRIFQKDYKSDSKTSGMGLGLYLVSKIIKGYNGTIKVLNRVENNYKQGSNFVIILDEKKL